MDNGCHRHVDQLCSIRKSHAQPSTRPGSNATALGRHVSDVKGHKPADTPACIPRPVPSTGGVAPMTGTAIRTDTAIDPEELSRREHAARVIQEAFKTFLEKRDAKKTNKFGVKFMVNLHPLRKESRENEPGVESQESKERQEGERLRRYYFDATKNNNLITLEKGKDSDHGLNGADKHCVIIGKGMLSFVTSTPWNPATPPLQEALKGLDRMVLPQWLNARRMVMRNAGIDLGFNKEPVALKGFQKLVSQLDEMHRLGYFHLDIKLNNLCIDTDGEISLIDCDGIKQVLRTKPLVYTPGYMPVTCVADIENGAQGPLKSTARLMLMDRYAMLCSLIMATQASLGLSKPELERFNRVNHARQVFNGILARDPEKLKKYDFRQDHYPSLDQVLEKQFNTWVYARNFASARFIDRWIAKYIKSEYRETVTFLLTHPKLYLEYLADQPLPLYEMLDWQAN